MNTKPNATDFTLTDDKFREYVRNHHKFTTNRPLGESLIPELIVITRSPEGNDAMTICALAVAFNEAHEKQGILYRLGMRFFSERRVVAAVILVSEAWVSVLPQGVTESRVQPRHDPNRKENIIVVGSGLPKDQRLLVTTPVKRDEKNNMVIDGESKEMHGASFPLVEWFWKGFFATIMDHPTPQP